MYNLSLATKPELKGLILQQSGFPKIFLIVYWFFWVLNPFQVNQFLSWLKLTNFYYYISLGLFRALDKKYHHLKVAQIIETSKEKIYFYLTCI